LHQVRRFEEEPGRRSAVNFDGLLIVVATLLISTTPLYAQQQNVANLKEDARKRRWHHW